MNALVLYDSLFGNTHKVANVIAATLTCHAVVVRDFREAMLDGISLLVVGSPIQGWRPTVALLSALASLSPSALRGKHVAAFDTRFNTMFSGNAARKILATLAAHGGEAVAPPEGFIVKGKAGPLAIGELERALAWGTNLAHVELSRLREEVEA